MKSVFRFTTLGSFSQAKYDIKHIAETISNAIKHSDARVKSLDPDGTDEDLKQEIKSAQSALEALDIAHYWLEKIID